MLHISQKFRSSSRHEIDQVARFTQLTVQNNVLEWWIRVNNALCLTMQLDQFHLVMSSQIFLMGGAHVARRIDIISYSCSSTHKIRYCLGRKYFIEGKSHRISSRSTSVWLILSSITGNLCKAVPRFGEFCSCCCLPLVPQLACNLGTAL